tara:strand:- start:1409 stop:1972 length:564 start_codon:yes stop_codon:yes gene_type:complete
MAVIFLAIAGLSSTLSKLIAATSDLATNQALLIERDYDLLGLIGAEVDTVEGALALLDAQQQQIVLLTSALEELDATSIERSGRESGTSRVDEFIARLDAIESAITTNPEQALTIPMIRVNIDSLTRELNEVHDNVNVSLNQTHDDIQSIWYLLVTSLVVLVAALLAAVVTLLRRQSPTQGAEHGSR